MNSKEKWARKRKIRSMGLSSPNSSMKRRAFATSNEKVTIYVGPSTEGEDQVFVKVYSGKVNDQKPSFATH